MPAHVVGTSPPSGVVAPRPVTTTRWESGNGECGMREVSFGVPAES
jgi:hypothetical protein